MSSLTYYAICIIAIIIAFFLIKRVVSCMIRSVIAIILLAVLAYLYFAHIV